MDGVEAGRPLPSSATAARSQVREGDKSYSFGPNVLEAEKKG